MRIEVEKSPYRKMLIRELEKRCHRNPKYSLRSFARDLQMAPARLSDVLRGRYGISVKAAAQLAAQLGFNSQESQYFCDLVESEHARSNEKKIAAQSRLKAAFEPPDHQRISEDSFAVISDWYHYAILELLDVEDFKSDPKWISQQLGINIHACRSAIDRLSRLGLLKREGQSLKASEGFTTTTDEAPSEAIRRFHRQILEKALMAIDLQAIEQRSFSSMVMAIDPHQLPEAKESIKKFRRKFNKEFGSSNKKRSVYCLGLQFFSLQQNEQARGK